MTQPFNSLNPRESVHRDPESAGVVDLRNQAHIRHGGRAAVAKARIANHLLNGLETSFDPSDDPGLYLGLGLSLCSQDPQRTHVVERPAG